MTVEEAFGIVKQWADSVGAVNDEFVVPPNGEGIDEAIALLTGEGYMDASSQDGLDMTEKGKEYLATHDPPITCDFCLTHKDVIWTYPVDHSKYIKIMSTEGPTWDNDDWAACIECHDDIERGNWDGVIERATRNNERLYGQSRHMRRAGKRALKTMHRDFMKVRVGPAIRDPWALPPLQ